MSKTRPMAFVTQPEAVEIWERPLPPLGELDVLIKVRAVAICGSDLHIFKGKHPAVSLPVPVGHEIAGEVTEVGAGVTKVKPGDRVTVEPVIVCGECHFCQRGDYHLCANISFQYRQGQGGLTTDFVASERWVHLLPENVSYAAGALIEPLSVAVHAVRRANFNISESVAIFGAGAIGLLILQVARANGAGEIFISDIRESRLSVALDFGASKALNSLKSNPVEEILKQTNGIGVQRAFEAVGLEITLNQALQALQKGGEAVLVGLFEEARVALPANIFVQKELTLVGSQGYHWDFQRAIELLNQGKINLERMITHQFHIEQTQQAFETLIDPDQEAVKVVISSE
jgi:2-desacetyl-2-hydroxyethyl bacteriochlorophyllide A dehydrogenase